MPRANAVFETLADMVDDTDSLVSEMDSVLDHFHKGTLTHDDLVRQFHRTRNVLNNINDEVRDEVGLETEA